MPASHRQPASARSEHPSRPSRSARMPRTGPVAKQSAPLTHLDAQGQARMVDVGGKPVMWRRAVAQGDFVAASATLDRLWKGDLPKGEALAVARLAGIQAAKRTDELIPLCHSLPLDQVVVDFARIARQRMRVTATATLAARTGVEMEVLTAVAVACLTLYDMTKAIDKHLRIEDIRLVNKTKRPVASSP